MSVQLSPVDDLPSSPSLLPVSLHVPSDFALAAYYVSGLIDWARSWSGTLETLSVDLEHKIR